MWDPKDLAGYESQYKREVQALNIHRKAMEQSMLVYTEHARQLSRKQKPNHQGALIRKPFQTRLAAALARGEKVLEKDSLDYTYPFYQQRLDHVNDLEDLESARRPASDLQLCVGRPLSRWVANDSRPSTDMNGNILPPQKLFPFSPRRAKLGVFKKHPQTFLDDKEDDLVLSLDTNGDIAREERRVQMYPGRREEGLKAMSLVLHDKSPWVEKSLEYRRLSLPNAKRRKKSKKTVTEQLPQVEDQSVTESNHRGEGCPTTVENTMVNQMEAPKAKEHGMNVVRLTPTSSGSPGCKTPTLVLYQSKPTDNPGHIEPTAEEQDMEVDDERVSDQQQSDQSRARDYSENVGSDGQVDEDLDNVTSAADMVMP